LFGLGNSGKMFKNTFQSGFLSILYSLGTKPLQIWDKEGALLFILGFSLTSVFYSCYTVDRALSDIQDLSVTI
jgi:hypothetical protein